MAVEAAGSFGTPERVLGFYALLLTEAELDLMFVTDDAQGRGIGRLLVAHLTDRAREAGLTGVRVVAHPPSEGFYLSVGAGRTGTEYARPCGRDVGPARDDPPDLLTDSGTDS